MCACMIGGGNGIEGHQLGLGKNTEIAGKIQRKDTAVYFFDAVGIRVSCSIYCIQDCRAEADFPLRRKKATHF